VNVEVGGRGEKKKTLELEDLEQIQIQLLQIKDTNFKNKREPQPKQTKILDAQNWQHKRKVLS